MATATYTVEIGWSSAETGVFVIGTSELGGGDVLGGAFLAPTFTGTNDDVTADVMRVTTKRGRDDQLDPMQAGSCTLVLTDPDGTYNPRNDSSTLAGQLLPMRPVRVRATFSGTTYGIFLGFIRSIEYDPVARQATINAIDAFVWMNRVRPVIDSTGETTTGAAIGLILDSMGFTDSSLRDLAVGDMIPDFSSDGSKTALALVQDLLTAERGIVYVSGDGVVTYEGRNARAQRTTAVDTVDDVMVSVNPGVDLDRIANRATVTATGGTAQTATDDDSIATYGASDYTPITSSYLADDDQALQLAHYIVGGRKSPRLPASGLTLMNDSSSTLTKILARELGDRVTVAESTGGTSGDWQIESIAHEISAGGQIHVATWALSAREAGDDAFIIGTSKLSGGDVLTY
jgi:hypothetical protein